MKMKKKQFLIQQDLYGDGISVEYFEYINASLRTIATFVNTTFIQHDKVTSTIVYTAISLGSSHICKTDLRSNYLQLQMNKNQEKMLITFCTSYDEYSILDWRTVQQQQHDVGSLSTTNGPNTVI